jgi:hypothetical protein
MHHAFLAVRGVMNNYLASSNLPLAEGAIREYSDSKTHAMKLAQRRTRG